MGTFHYFNGEGSLCSCGCGRRGGEPFKLTAEELSDMLAASEESYANPDHEQVARAVPIAERAFEALGREYGFVVLHSDEPEWMGDDRVDFCVETSSDLYRSIRLRVYDGTTEYGPVVSLTGDYHGRDATEIDRLVRDWLP